MRVQTFNDAAKLCIYRSSRMPDLDYFYLKKKEVSHEMVLIIGSTGSGKTNFVNFWAEELKKHGCTVIYVTEKNGKELANAMQEFPVSEEWQKILLERFEIKELTKEQLKDNVKIHHPFIFEHAIGAKFLSQKLPLINFFTFPIKSLTETDLKIILAGTADNETVMTSQRILSQMSDDDSLWDFLWEINEQINKKVKEEYDDIYSDPDKMFLNVKTKGRISTISDIRDKTSTFKDNFFLHKGTCRHNINFEEIINDQKHTHFLTKKWIKDDRLRTLVDMMFIEGIVDALDKGKAKHPIVLVFEELRKSVPKVPETTYEKAMVAKMAELLTTIRALGQGVTVLATTQNFFLINEQVRDSVSEKVVGYLAEGDKARMMKNLGFKPSDIATINELQPGMFVWWKELASEIGVKFQIFVPPFAVEDTKHDYFDLCRRYYPEKMRIHREVKVEMLKEQKEIYKHMEARVKALRDRAKEQKKLKEQEEQKKQDEKNVKPLKKSLLAEEVSVNKSLKAEKMKLCYETACQNPSMSWNKVAEACGVSPPAAAKYAVLHAYKIKDKNFFVSRGLTLPKSMGST